MFIKEFVKKILYGNRYSSETYIKYLKRLGVKIGERTVIFSPRETFIDEQYPWMVEIGNDVQITPIMSLGGKGVISVLSNVMPQEAHDIAAAALDGDFKKSAELQLKYLELCNALFMDVNPIPVKVAMRMMGFDVGPLRLPLCDMSEEKTEHLRKVLAKYGLIK